MEDLGAIIVAALGLEALVQLLKNIWKEKTRNKWSITRAVVVLLAIAASIVGDINFMADSGLDFGVNLLGQVLSGLALGRAANWVHKLI